MESSRGTEPVGRTLRQLISRGGSRFQTGEAMGMAIVTFGLALLGAVIGGFMCRDQHLAILALGGVFGGAALGVLLGWPVVVGLLFLADVIMGNRI